VLNNVVEIVLVKQWAVSSAAWVLLSMSNLVFAIQSTK
jgi:hypothetical protein